MRNRTDITLNGSSLQGLSTEQTDGVNGIHDNKNNISLRLQ